MKLDLCVLLLLLGCAASASDAAQLTNLRETSALKGARGSTEHERVLQKDEDSDDGDDLLEIHPCEPDPQRAIDYVNILGHGEKGDQDCLADPVNACPGGCCRFHVYFICDTSNFAPHLACVCNQNTAPSQDIVQTALAAGSFGTLVDLVQTAGLVEALRGPGPFTLFAPVDSAFPPAGPLYDAFRDAPDVGTLTKILLYHVVQGEVKAADLEEGGTLTTLEGSTIAFSLANGPKVNEANIVQTDIATTNGVIHVIDAVLTPPPLPDVVDTAIAAGSFTTLVDLVSMAGLEETLRSPGPFTIFAPNDEAFPSGADLEVFKANTDLDTLIHILTYHVIPGYVRAVNLMDGMTLTSVQGQTLTVSLNTATGNFEVNGATILSADIEASNGIIHVIDDVLMPSM